MGAVRPTAAFALFATAGAALAGLVLQAGPARAQTTPVLPGYWDSTDSVVILGESHQKKCLTEVQIAKFMAAPSNKHYDCTYASHVVADGKATFRGGACYSHAGRKVLSNVSVDGRYAPESFRLTFHFELMVNPKVGFPGSATIDAHRISAECPAEPTK